MGSDAFVEAAERVSFASLQAYAAIAVMLVRLAESLGVRPDGSLRRPVLLDVDSPPFHGQELFEARMAKLALQPFAATVGPGEEGVEQSGWGVVYPQGLAAQVKAALAPLLELRRVQGATAVVELEYRPTESADDFMRRVCRERNGAAFPSDRMTPLYLLLIGGPDAIPFEVQADLAADHWVGRLAFAEAAGYATYASSVVAHETSPVVRERALAVWAPRHGFDAPTQLSADRVARVLAPHGNEWGGVATARTECIGEQATRAALMSLLRGQEGKPAVLFTASHGVETAPGDALQTSLQGALVTQEWRRGSALASGVSYLAGSDLPEDCAVHGMLVVCFGCFTAGTPVRDGLGEAAGTDLAPVPFVGALPQRLLSLASGPALGVIGHVDRALTSSIRVPRACIDVSPFKRMVKFALAGLPLGQAVALFSERTDQRSAALLNLLRTQAGSPQQRAQLWCERNDARGFVLLGDPAVRLAT